jgi:hypothetical protein
MPEFFGHLTFIVFFEHISGNEEHVEDEREKESVRVRERKTKENEGNLAI